MAKSLLKTFVIDIRDGNPAFTSPTQRALFFKFLKQFEGKKVWMTLDTKIPTRTDRQNRFYWLYVGIIASETGHTPDELHNAFKQRFLFRGARDVYGEIIRRTGSTTELNKLDFGEYLEKICELTGIPIPDASIFEVSLSHEEFRQHQERYTAQVRTSQKGK